MSRNRVLLRGPYQRISRKDLRNVVIYLKHRRSKGKNLLQTVQGLIQASRPIPYRVNLTGAKHRAGIGPARTPIKVYRYVRDTLKNFKSHPVDDLLTGMFVQQSSDRYRGGYRRAARGRAYRADARRYRLVLQMNVP